MTSIIEGYNYDIFISYRQKDNKGDRWVSEFVYSLKTELESTFKEEISVYFDINPHDGLLETHDVDASLKEKLKCLIFIPIISRTYCDPKSFAWEHELKAFVELASKDQFGLKVKLARGNVASRVLPVRIYDLDTSDKQLCESVLGGVLRGVDFIYKSPGVNRPLLTKEENPKDNLDNTVYRDQINKVANSIREIIQGLSAEPAQVLKVKEQPEEANKEVREGKRKIEPEEAVKSYKNRWVPVVAVLAVLIIAAILAYPKIFKKDRLEKFRSSGERISVAVMPFQNMTNDTIWNVWQEGIQDILINSLSTSQELRIRQAEFINNLVKNQGIVNYASVTPSVASKISHKLDANVFIYGNIKEAGNTIRLYAQLVESKSKEVFKSFQIQGDNTEENIFNIVDSLSIEIKNLLIVSNLKQGHLHNSPSWISTGSPEAFRYYLNGRDFFYKRDYNSARSMFLKALALDSNLSIVYIFVSASYANQGMFDQAKHWCLKAYERREQMPIMDKLLTNWLYSSNFETPNKEIIHLKDILGIDDQSPTMYFLLGNAYYNMMQYDNAIPMYEKALELYEKWDSKPRWIYGYTSLADAYHKIGQYGREKKLYKKAENDFPDDPLLLAHQAVLALSEDNPKDANYYIEKYKVVRKEMSASEAAITNSIASIYSDAGILDKAEEYYRQALSMEPENPMRMNNLAWFLIDNDKNITEGMDLIDKALVLSPDDYAKIDTKGWGLYKQGKYQEALEILQKSWNLRMEKARYDHESFLHLEAAKKAVASQKNN